MFLQMQNKLVGIKAAIEAQIAALEAYKGTNDDAIAGLKADLEKLQAGELTEAMVAKLQHK